MESTIKLESHEEARLLFGPGDANLRKVREHFGVKIVARGSFVRLSGDQESTEAGVAVLESLRDRIRGGEITIPGQSMLALEDMLSRTQTAPVPGAAVDKAGYLAQPRSDGQARYIKEMEKNDIVLCIGPAGTGKTYLAVMMAVTYLKAGKVQKIVLVRPAVEAGEKLGFLPGDFQAKISPYLRPLYDALYDLLDFELVRKYRDRDVIEIVPLAYMRGRTLNRAFIILDEAQNTTTIQMKMFLTRMGERSRIVVTGDITQIDLPRRGDSGLLTARKILKDIPGINFTYLDKKDIVRHKLVQDIVTAYERLQAKDG
ncbi:MAG: PhoH family protein [Planctomycetota bacterium]|nr:MAG: PhoH family protein [Planctomycetota bacterium]